MAPSLAEVVYHNVAKDDIPSTPAVHQVSSTAPEVVSPLCNGISSSIAFGVTIPTAIFTIVIVCMVIFVRLFYQRQQRDLYPAQVSTSDGLPNERSDPASDSDEESPSDSATESDEEPSPGRAPGGAAQRQAQLDSAFLSTPAEETISFHSVASGTSGTVEWSSNDIPLTEFNFLSASV